MNGTLSAAICSTWLGFYTAPALAQSNNDTLQVRDDIIYGPNQIHPSFVGGEQELFCFFDQNVHEKKLNELDVTGISWARFTIDTLGSIHDIRIVRSVHSEVDQELVRIIQLMPNWTPGSQYGKVVSVDHLLPLKVPYVANNCR